MLDKHVLVFLPFKCPNTTTHVLVMLGNCGQQTTGCMPLVWWNVFCELWWSSCGVHGIKTSISFVVGWKLHTMTSILKTLPPLFTLKFPQILTIQQHSRYAWEFHENGDIKTQRCNCFWDCRGKKINNYHIRGATLFMLSLTSHVYHCTPALYGYREHSRKICWCACWRNTACELWLGNLPR